MNNCHFLGRWLQKGIFVSSFDEKLLFPRGGSYIRTSVCEIGGLFVEQVGSYIKGPCPENRRALT